MQKLVTVTSPQTGSRMRAEDQRGGWLADGEKQADREQPDRSQLEGMASRSRIRRKLGSAGQVAKTVVPDQIEGMAAGPAGDGADRDQSQDQEG